MVDGTKVGRINDKIVTRSPFSIWSVKMSKHASHVEVTKDGEVVGLMESFTISGKAIIFKMIDRINACGKTEEIFYNEISVPRQLVTFEIIKFVEDQLEMSFSDKGGE